MKLSCAGPIRDGNIDDPTRYGSHLVAALGINWAHAVTIRLVLEAKSGLFDTVHFGIQGRCPCDEANSFCIG